ncbi:MAG: DUF4386 domain-containing protein [Flavisolibacter sp.]
MKQPISLRKTARAGGILYLVIILTGIFGEIFVRGKLIVQGDPDATAKNIMDFPLLWRAGIANDLLMHVCDIPLLIIFYTLFRPVNKFWTLTALLFALVQSAVLVAFKLNLFTSLIFLEHPAYLQSFRAAQMNILSYVSIIMDGYGFGVGLLFFGFACLIFGQLIFVSGFIPRIIGRLMQLAGLCYIINSFALILAPKFASTLFPWIMMPSFIGESSFCLWLIIKGVREVGDGEW